MKVIIIDSNIIIAALIKDSVTRKMITDLHPHLYYPEIMAREIMKYKEIIKKKARMDEDQFHETCQKIFKYIKFIPDEELLRHKGRAEKIMAEIDPGDQLLLAAAFCFDDSVIWSNDPHLQKQKIVKTHKTEELLKKINEYLNE